MKIFLTFVLSYFGFAAIFAQQDSIYIQAKISETHQLVTVRQEIYYHNLMEKDLDKIKLFNWIAAYKNRKTPLLKRLLEDRKKSMYFAKPEDLGSLQNLSVKIGSSEILNLDTEKENLYLPLSKQLKKGEAVKIVLSYELKLPSSHFTSYGTSPEKINLKYFFLVPDCFDTENQTEKNYINIEENQTHHIFWKVLLDVPINFFSKSNLPEIYPNYFQGVLKNDPEFLISKVQFPKMNLEVNEKTVMVDFGYQLTDSEKANLEFYLPLHLRYIQQKTDLLPEKIYLSEKFRKDENFIGIDDLNFGKFRFQLFSDAEKTDLNYFGIITKNVLKQNLAFDKNTDHWLINGLKTQLEIDYLENFYKDRKLLGDLPNNAKILGMKPLKLSHASKLNLIERYGLGYHYIESENFDQKISEPFGKLSNFNKTAISNFETGTLFSHLSNKMGNENYYNFIKKYIAKNENQKINQQTFLDEFALASNYSSDFLDQYILHKQRINFDLKKYKKEGDNFEVKISKSTTERIPFKIETEEKDGSTKTFWFDTDDSINPVNYNIPQANATKILVNKDYSFPESSFRDNYLYTKGLFANMKKLKLKLFRDIPNPEYNEIYLSPRFNFNAYDGFLLGINFKNTAIFRRNFAISVTPYYSTKTNQFTGTASSSYTFMPAESFFRFLQFGVSGSYFHYDYNLKYQRLGAFANMNFTKNPRSDISRSLYFSYNYYDRDLTPIRIAENEYKKYNLWNLGYNYIDQRLIHESIIGAGLQWMEDFQKISAEVFYRYEYAENKKISFRGFAGYFLSNKTQNNLFDFGVARVSNYAFSYGLIGQSASTGLLSQQLIIADGGFKSYVAPSVNQWIGTINMDTNVWKWIHIYADVGMYKNKFQNPEFIWDSGVKLRVIPDFLELYFPIQSSLGFEPSFDDYAKRIRFTLVLNFGAIGRYAKRGVF